jgi:hypothetical protein
VPSEGLRFKLLKLGEEMTDLAVGFKKAVVLKKEIPLNCLVSEFNADS